jgi:lipopolysaccharide biosynthesis regulator YciM
VGLELLFLLLPLAALSGWWIGRRSAGTGRDCLDNRDFSSRYFKGLNYLLNEQQDKAIAVFIQMLEVDSETVETHFALANLFLRRGEVDRAIRIHQNLIARPTLTREQRNQALYELGSDYMRAGLLDRAESLFQELTGDTEFGPSALRQLLDIYQQEKEWEKAITVARRLEGNGFETARAVIAHYYCEMAELSRDQGDSVQAQRYAKRALDEDKLCVRASLVEARLLTASGNWKGAVKALRRVEAQDPAFVPETIAPLHECYTALQRPQEMIDYLRGVYASRGGISTLLALAELLRSLHGEKPAVEFVAEQLRTRPSVRGVEWLINAIIQQGDGASRDDLLVLRELSHRMLDGKPVYKCSQCGFAGKTLHWCCPSCRDWNTVKPIQGIEGE